MQPDTAIPHPSHPQVSVIVPALVILIGLGLRVIMLGQDMRFHPDEALFAAQARLITTQGDWLLRTTDLDKPPLTFYAVALSFRALGISEWTARLPNVLFSALAVAALYALALTLYHDRPTATLAALLLALSPFDLAFAATLFTDVPATFWVICAAWLAARDRWRAAGTAAALVCATKPTAMLALPIIVALGIARQARQAWTWRDLVVRLWRFAWPLLLGIALLVLWDVARAPRSFWSLGWQRNAPGRLTRSDELVPRLREWLRLAAYMTGSQPLNAVLLSLGAPWIIGHLFRRRARAAMCDMLIAAYGLAFLAWYWLVAFNTYDRYLHALTPLVLLMAARILIGAWHALTRRTETAATALLLTALVSGVLLPGTLTALRGDISLGGDHGKHTGIDTLANTLNTTLDGAILYDYWLGWELAYYLGPNPAPQVRYMPQPEALANDLAGASDTRYLVAPSPQDAALWLTVLRHANILPAIIYHDTANGFVVYRLG